MYRLENIKIREELTTKEILQKACNKYKVKIENITQFLIYKKSIDARNKDDVYYNYTIDVESKTPIKNAKKVENNIQSLKVQVNRKSKARPVIIGAGPAGLFCALTLVYNGIKPIIIEQGKTVEERKKDVDQFFKTGELNTQSNVQFGEGGAGTFSDGKLTTGTHNPLCKRVLKEFVKFGAPEQIMYINKPHIGTDNLIKIVANMRKEIIKLGGEFLFNEKVTDINIKNGNLETVICSKNIKTDTAVFAIGHSARDTFEKLYEKGINMEKKIFSVGLRIEHKQKMINSSQYGTKTKLKLPSAEYKLVYHGKECSCYTFCMCPGGQVVASSSENGTIVTNGMSTFARDGENANSAILVNVLPQDFKGASPLEGMYFQKELEEKAFKLGKGNFYAPIQRVEDFIKNVETIYIGDVKPTYLPGVTMSNLNTILPQYVSTTIKEAIQYFDTKIKGFANPDAILTGVETRSSSPVKIIRNEKLMANINGIYPCGEGAGYAGGIMTAAVDGIKCAMAILQNP